MLVLSTYSPPPPTPHPFSGVSGLRSYQFAHGGRDGCLMMEEKEVGGAGTGRDGGGGVGGG